MNIIVYGWYGHGNIGDESFKLAFQKIYPQHTFSFTDTDKDFHEQGYDLCIIGGGDIICKQNLDIISTLKCPKIALSVTITRNSLIEEINILDFIYTRDVYSEQLLIDYGYYNCDYIPDVSLVLDPNVENGKKLIRNYFQESKSDQYEKVCSLIVNAHLLPTPESPSKLKSSFDKFINDLAEFMDTTSMSFLLVPYSMQYPWDDRVTNSYINSQCKYFNKNAVIFDKLDVQETLDIIGASDLVITTRFHGLIFGLASQVPTITISSHDKNTYFLNTIEMDYLDYWNFNSEKLKEMLDEKNTSTIDFKERIKKYNEICFLQ
jgi:polysaccharide pyruvyl transferase WcaK-like protein